MRTRRGIREKEVDVVVRPLDGGWGWFVVLGGMLGHFFLVGLARSIGVFYIEFKERYQGSDVATAMVQSIFNTARTVTGPFVSMLCDRFSTRSVVMVGGVIFGAGCVMSAFSTSLLYLAFSFGLVAGLGGSLTFTPIFIIMNQYFDKKKGKAMSLATVGSGIGTIVLAPLQVLLLTVYGYSGAFLIVGGLALNTCVSGALFRPIDSILNSPRTKKPCEETTVDDISLANVHCELELEVEPTTIAADEKPIDNSLEVADTTLVSEGCPQEEAQENASKSNCLGRCKSRFVLFRSWTYCLYALHMTALPCGVQIVVVFVPSLMKQLGMTTEEGAMVLAISGAADIAGRLFWGVIFDLKAVRHRRRLLHHGIGVLFAISVLLYSFQTHLVGFILVGIFWGLVEGGWHSQRATLGAVIVPKDQLSNSMGYMTFFQGLGNLLFPTVAGLLKDISGTYRWCFVLGFSWIMLTSIGLLLDYFARHLPKRCSVNKNGASDTNLEKC